MAVTVYEAAPQVGGLAAGFKAPHWEWSLEQFYHHWFASDKHMLGLIERLGWRDQVVFPRPYTMIYYQGKFYALDSYVEAFKFTLSKFGPIDLIRFGLTGLYLKLDSALAAAGTGHSRRLDAQDDRRTHLQRAVAATAGGQVRRGQPGGGQHGLAVGAHPRAQPPGWAPSWAASRPSWTSWPICCAAAGVEIRLSTPVTQIRRAGRGPGRTVDGGQRRGLESYDAVISTSSPALMAKLAPDLPDSYSASLRSLKSMGAIVLVVTLDRQLTRYYWHSLPKEAGFPYLAMVEHTNFIGPEHYGGDHILYLGDYLETGHEYFSLSKEELLERFLPSLTALQSGLSAAVGSRMSGCGRPPMPSPCRR
ncbi:MAG: FAD-dependent oxidoreductase [Microthrixaceae bacterium]